jgi:hypothetical protein
MALWGPSLRRSPYTSVNLIYKSPTRFSISSDQRKILLHFQVVKGKVVIVKHAQGRLSLTRPAFKRNCFIKALPTRVLLEPNFFSGKGNF